MADFESLIRAWNGESVIVHYDQPSDAMIFIAIHSSRLGPATGGTRMHRYNNHTDALRDVLKLAEGMTRKFAIADFPRGGGKAVISTSAPLFGKERTGLLERYGRLIGQLNGLFYTGPDIGTSPEDMDVIAERGKPFVHSCTPDAGGAGSSGPATALGVFTGMQVMCEHLFGDRLLKNRTVLVQGAGSVGAQLIRHLKDAGAGVMFSDVDDQTAQWIRRKYDIPFVAPGDVFDTPCDILSPCAMGGILNHETVGRLKCKAVVGGANNQLESPGNAENLMQRGIVYAPDYVVNFGGAIAITGIESLGWSHEQAMREVAERVETSLTEILGIAKDKRISTEYAAEELATRRLTRYNKQTAGTTA